MPINPFAPLIMFAILFGLSMDDELFLLSARGAVAVTSSRLQRPLLALVQAAAVSRSRSMPITSASLGAPSR
jgi:hypothetical protein